VDSWLGLCVFIFLAIWRLLDEYTLQMSTKVVICCPVKGLYICSGLTKSEMGGRFLYEGVLISP